MKRTNHLLLINIFKFSFYKVFILGKFSSDMCEKSAIFSVRILWSIYLPEKNLIWEIVSFFLEPSEGKSIALILRDEILYRIPIKPLHNKKVNNFSEITIKIAMTSHSQIEADMELFISLDFSVQQRQSAGRNEITEFFFVSRASPCWLFQCFNWIESCQWWNFMQLCWLPKNPLERTGFC